MKADIHPQYYADVKVTCACGETFSVGSTIKSISVEICSACHPFYTGVEKIVDTAGRVEKFKAHRAAGEKSAKVAASKTKASKTNSLKQATKTGAGKTKAEK